MFDRFQRGLSEPSGNGLGLAIVETLAARWGGSATIRNRVGVGACAEVALPLEPARERRPKVAS